MLVAIAPGNTTTFWATLAGVPRVNVDHGNAAFGGLILDENTELAESPGVLNLSLLLGYPHAVADVFQVFHYDNVSGLTRLDNRLANPVVEVAHPSLLFTRQPSQEALGPFRAFGLQRLPQFGVMLPNMHSLPSRKLQTIGCAGEVVDSAVNAKDISAFWWERNFAVDNNMNVEFFGSTVITQSSGSRFLFCEQTALEVANIKFKFKPAADGSNRNFFPLLDKREGAGIKAHAGGFELPGFGLLALFLGGFGDTSNSTNNKVSVETIFILNSVVAKMLQLHLVSCLIVQ